MMKVCLNQADIFSLQLTCYKETELMLQIALVLIYFDAENNYVFLLFKDYVHVIALQYFFL